ncbi:MAG TPA: hypothetical protein PLL89_04610 [bacterium]|nr:hypothetical protein [bacterium]HPC29476.1 hypothetical protein [bacterium]HRV04813.1 hypothetical protein [Candidatus Ratteibacteria bacterium]
MIFNEIRKYIVIRYEGLVYSIGIECKKKTDVHRLLIVRED